MNCKQTPSQLHYCPYWNGVKCCDVTKFVNRETGEEMCRFNTSAVHHSEYRETSVVVETAPSASANSDYTAALREGLMQFLEDESPVLFEDIDFSKLATRLNSAIKASQNCA